MKYFLLLVPVVLMLSCQGTKQTAMTDYHLLNGIWEGDCNMIVVGEFKGELECPIMETVSTTTIVLNDKNEGTWVYQSNDNRPDTTKAKLIMREKQAILLMERRGETWESEIHSVTQDSLKVFTRDKESVRLLRRKK